MKISLRLIGLFGLIIFSGFFSLTFLSANVVENAAKGFIHQQVETEVKEKYNASKTASFMNRSSTLLNNVLPEGETEAMTDSFKAQLPIQIANVVHDLCKSDCEKIKHNADNSDSKIKGFIKKFSQKTVADKTLEALIKEKYQSIVANLKTDLRIFLGANACVFLLILLFSFFKPQAIAHLFLPSGLLLLATISASLIYIFGQDWFYSILYNDYMGLTYLLYLSVIFAFLVDIAMNKAKVTCEIINAIFEAIGSALEVAPC